MPRGSGNRSQLVRLLPRRKKVYDLFFKSVGDFLKGPGKNLEQAIFDEQLTRAAVEDSERVLSRVANMWHAIDSIRDAFQPELVTEIYAFVRKYRMFAWYFTKHNEQIPHTHFPAYVKKVNEHIDSFLDIKKRFKLRKAPFTWPSPAARKEIIFPVNLKWFVKLGTYAEFDGHQPIDDRMVAGAIKNFQLAIKFTNILEDKVIATWYDNLIAWLTRDKCFPEVCQTFVDRATRFVSELKQLRATYEKEVKTLKRTKNDAEIQRIADRSVEAVLAARESLPNLLEKHNEIIQASICTVYACALEILDTFDDILEQVDAEDEKMNAERGKAVAALQKWEQDVEKTNNPASEEDIYDVHRDLPLVCRYAAHFTLEMYSLA